MSKLSLLILFTIGQLHSELLKKGRQIFGKLFYLILCNINDKLTLIHPRLCNKYNQLFDKRYYREFQFYKHFVLSYQTYSRYQKCFVLLPRGKQNYFKILPLVYHYGI